MSSEEKLKRAQAAMERTELAAESLSEVAQLKAQLAAETKRAENWRNMYREVYCRLWWSSEDEFENEAMGDGIDHSGVLVECDRMNKALSDVTDLQKLLAAAEARAKGLNDELQRYRKARAESIGLFNPANTYQVHECEAWSKVLALLPAGEEPTHAE